MIKLVFIALLFSSSLFGQNVEWYVDYDSSEQRGYIDKKGNLLLDLKYNLKLNSDNHTLELFDEKEIFKIENGHISKLK